MDDDKSPSHEASSVSLETELETQSSAGIHSTSASRSESESEFNDGAGHAEGCSNVRIRPCSLNIEHFLRWVLEILEQGAFNSLGSKNGNGLSGKMKRNQPSVIRVEWLFF